MNRNIAVIGIVLIVPLCAGGLIGYTIGRSPARAPGESKSLGGVPFTEAGTSSSGTDVRDSLSDVIGGSRGTR